MENAMDMNGKIENLIKDLAIIDGFDSTLFDQLVEDTTPEVSIKILARFYETLSESLDLVEQGITKNDADQVWKACHKVAGSAELLGFAEFGKLSRRLNNDIKSAHQIEPFKTELKGYLEQGRAVLAKIHQVFPDHKSYLQ